MICYGLSEASIIIRALHNVRRSLYFKQSMMSWWLFLHWDYSVFIPGFIISTRHNQTSSIQPADQSEAGCCWTLHQLLATEFWNRKINGSVGVNCLVIGSKICLNKFMNSLVNIQIWNNSICIKYSIICIISLIYPNLLTIQHASLHCLLFCFVVFLYLSVNCRRLLRNFFEKLFLMKILFISFYFICDCIYALYVHLNSYITEVIESRSLQNLCFSESSTFVSVLFAIWILLWHRGWYVFFVFFMIGHRMLHRTEQAAVSFCVDSRFVDIDAQ